MCAYNEDIHTRVQNLYVMFKFKENITQKHNRSKYVTTVSDDEVSNPVHKEDFVNSINDKPEPLDSYRSSSSISFQPMFEMLSFRYVKYGLFFILGISAISIMLSVLKSDDSDISNTMGIDLTQYQRIFILTSPYGRSAYPYKDMFMPMFASASLTARNANITSAIINIHGYTRNAGMFLSNHIKIYIYNITNKQPSIYIIHICYGILIISYVPATVETYFYAANEAVGYHDKALIVTPYFTKHPIKGSDWGTEKIEAGSSQNHNDNNDINDYDNGMMSVHWNHSTWMQGEIYRCTSYCNVILLRYYTPNQLILHSTSQGVTIHLNHTTTLPRLTYWMT